MGTGTLNPISASYTPSGKHTLCHVFFPWCTTDPKAMEPCDHGWKLWNCEPKQTFILFPFLLFLLFLRQVSCILGCFLARFVAKNKLWSCNLSTSMSQMHDYRDMPPCLVCVVVVVVIKPRICTCLLSYIPTPTFFGKSWLSHAFCLSSRGNTVGPEWYRPAGSSSYRFLLFWSGLTFEVVLHLESNCVFHDFKINIHFLEMSETLTHLHF